MRETPTWRIPFGIIALFVGLMIYGVVIARYAPTARPESLEGDIRAALG